MNSKKGFHAPWCEAKRELCNVCNVASSNFFWYEKRMSGVIFVNFSCILILRMNQLIVTLFNKSAFILLFAGIDVGNWFHGMYARKNDDIHLIKHLSA